MYFNSFTDFRMQPFLNIRMHCQGIGGHRYCCASGVKSGQQEEHTLRWWSVNWDWCYFGPWANMNQITCAATISSISDSSQFEFPPSTDSLMDSNAKVMKSSTSWNQSNNLSFRSNTKWSFGCFGWAERSTGRSRSGQTGHGPGYAQPHQLPGRAKSEN